MSACSASSNFNEILYYKIYFKKFFYTSSNKLILLTFQKKKLKLSTVKDMKLFILIYLLFIIIIFIYNFYLFILFNYLFILKYTIFMILFYFIFIFQIFKFSKRKNAHNEAIMIFTNNVKL